MEYITGQQALNLPCSLETCGDWHTSALQWEKLNMLDSETNFFGDYGIEENCKVPEHESLFFVANHIRASLDLLIQGKFSIVQGLKEDFICNDNYTLEIFQKVIELKDLDNWNEIDQFMGSEYKMRWVNYRRGK